MRIPESHAFTKMQLTSILERCIGKTISEVDEEQIPAKGKRNNGGGGGEAVIEHSVLKYPPDNARRPVLVIDSIKAELKKTGIIPSKTPKYCTKPRSLFQSPRFYRRQSALISLKISFLGENPTHALCLLLLLP